MYRYVPGIVISSFLGNGEGGVVQTVQTNAERCIKVNYFDEIRYYFQGHHFFLVSVPLILRKSVAK